MRKKMMNMRLRIKSRVTKFFLIVITLELAVFVWMFCDSRLVYNTTASMPIGLYYKTSEPVVRKSIILAKPHKSDYILQAIKYGYISENEILLKRVIGIPGDKVRITQEGIYVNDDLIANTRIFVVDTNKRPLIYKTLDKTLMNNEYIIVGDSEKSFDSRYFGIVTSDEVISTVVPLYVF